MKRFLQRGAVIWLAVLFQLSFSDLYSQCKVSNIIIQNVIPATTQGPGTCTVTFDVNFTIENNNGNKYIFIHAWTQAFYPNYFECVNGVPTVNGAVRAPEGDDLGEPFLNIAIANNGPTPVLLSEYTPDPTVPITPVAGISRQILPDGSAMIILTGVTVTLPYSCGIPTVLMADLWSSQGAQAQIAHCINCGIMYAAGFLTGSGFVNCSSLTFSASLTNNNGFVLNGYFRAYADVNGDTYFTPAVDTLIQDTTNFSVPSGTTITVSGSVPADNINQDIFLLVTLTTPPADGASRVLLLPTNFCGALPVTYRSFTATRQQSEVLLKWETATEINNRGFAILKNSGNGIWQVIGFVDSRAVGGNSSSILGYTFTDPNNSRNITQYRIRQVDLDGKFKLSEIRAVRGLSQKAKTIIYPNPSLDGQVNVLLPDLEGTTDVSLSDMNGRVLQQWKALNHTSLQINDLTQGLYTLRIYVRETGEQLVEKIVVLR